MPEQLPRTLGRYTLLEPLGQGGMGQVYLARVDGAHGLQKRCVVKTMHADRADDEGQVRRFLDEARLAMQLSHKNICPVFDAGDFDGVFYLAMDLVDGVDLRALWAAALAAGQPLSPALAAFVAVELLEGLDYAHRATDVEGKPLRVVHRDVSPHNVMVGVEGGVHLIDFGLAFSTTKLEKTDADVVHGKVAYMSPEQVQGAELDRRADVFAAAVVIYELFAHERFYEGLSQQRVLTTAAEGRFLPRAWKKLEAPLQKILRAALDADPKKRTSSAGKLADELRAWAACTGLHADAAQLRATLRALFADRVRLAGTERSTEASAAASRSTRAAPAREPTASATGHRDAALRELPTRGRRGSPRPAAPAEPTVVFAGAGDPAHDDDDPSPPPLASASPARTRVPSLASSASSAAAPRRAEPAAPPAREPRADVGVVVKQPLAAAGAQPPRKRRSTTDSVWRDAALGFGLVLIFVVLVAVAPWQKGAPRERKQALPPKSPATTKVAYVQRWCPDLPCLVELGKLPELDALDESASPSSSPALGAVNGCYLSCLGR
ncbi:MAG: serine/threonine protein kinase [Deltaproteobacteria bacterium]|nr:serine/threonine protein kinase [Deltaproteobacteria bacterium]